MIQITQKQQKVYKGYKKLGTFNRTWQAIKIDQRVIRQTLAELVEIGLLERTSRGRYIVLEKPFEVLAPPPMICFPDINITIHPKEREWMLNKYPNSIYQKKRTWAVERLREMGFIRTKKEVNYMALLLGVAGAEEHSA